MQRFNYYSALLLISLLAACRDTSRDIPCRISLPQGGLTTSPPPSILLNGFKVGAVADVSIANDSTLLAVLQLNGRLFSKKASFTLCRTGLLSNDYFVSVTNATSSPYLTAQDTVRVVPYHEPPGSLLDTTSIKLLDSLIRHVSRQFHKTNR